jgi:hypothetical protein
LLRKFKVSKQSLLISFICFLAFISTSTGFDFYAHSVSYYFFDEVINQSDLIFGRIVQPRYMLLSFIYEAFSRAGIPLGFVSTFLLIYPIYNIVIFLNKQRIKKINSHYSLYQIFIISFLFYSSILYSALSLVLLWLLAFALTRRKIFLLGGLFHPIGVIFTIIALVFISKKTLFKFIFGLFLFYFILYFFTINQIFTSVEMENIRFRIDGNFISLLHQIFDRKMNELLQLTIIGSLLWLSFREAKVGKLHNLIKYSIGIGGRIFIRRIFFNTSLVILYFIFYIYMLGKPSLVNNLIDFNINNVIYISWFDFGSKEISVGYSDLYDERYWKDQ